MIAQLAPTGQDKAAPANDEASSSGRVVCGRHKLILEGNNDKIPPEYYCLREPYHEDFCFTHRNPAGVEDGV